MKIIVNKFVSMIIILCMICTIMPVGSMIYADSSSDIPGLISPSDTTVTKTLSSSSGGNSTSSPKPLEAVNVAKIGNTEYTSLKLAAEAAKSGDLIELIANDSANQEIVIAKDITIDLMGYDLSSTKFKFNSGTSILRDSKGSGKINSSHSGGVKTDDDITHKSKIYSTICVQGTANVSLNDITVEYPNSDLDKVIYIGGTNAGLTINGGSYSGGTSNGDNGIFFNNINNTSTLIINDGYISGRECICAYNGFSTQYFKLNKAHLTCNNAPFYIEDGSGSVSLESDIQKLIDTTSTIKYTGGTSAFSSNDFWITSNMLVKSSGFFEEKHGSIDKNNPAEINIYNSSVTLQPKVIGGDNTALTYKWFKDDNINPIASSSDYTPTEAGIYTVAVSDGTASYNLYWKITKNPPHTMSYTAENNTITQKCSISECIIHNATATITAPQGNPVYDGKTNHTASVAYIENWQGGDLEIKYSKGGEAAADTISAGEYTASITISEKTASVIYSVAKLTPIILTPPNAKRILKNNSLNSSSLTEGTVTGADNGVIEGVFTWNDNTIVPPGVGSHSYKVTFTPADSVNYNLAECDATVSVYVHSTPRYVVKFDSNGGSKVANKTVIATSAMIEPAQPERYGYIFDGWYSDKNLTKEYNFKSPVNKSFTLYAKWIKDDAHEDEPDTDNDIDNDTDTDTDTDIDIDTDEDKEWKQFSDVRPHDWYYDVVKEAYQSGLITGTEENLFSPEDSITRAMFVTILWRAEGQLNSGTASFDDIPRGEYYEKAVAWANKNEIVHGYTKDKFYPDMVITREQMAAILYRYAEYKGMNAVNTKENLSHFTDRDKITGYAVTPMNWAVGEGIISGKGYNILDPEGYATRAEAAAMLVRFINNIG